MLSLAYARIYTLAFYFVIPNEREESLLFLYLYSNPPLTTSNPLRLYTITFTASCYIIEVKYCENLQYFQSIRVTQNNG